MPGSGGHGDSRASRGGHRELLAGSLEIRITLARALRVVSAGENSIAPPQDAVRSIHAPLARNQASGPPRRRIPPRHVRLRPGAPFAIILDFNFRAPHGVIDGFDSLVDALAHHDLFR